MNSYERKAQAQLDAFAKREFERRYALELMSMKQAANAIWDRWDSKYAEFARAWSGGIVLERTTRRSTYMSFVCVSMNVWMEPSPGALFNSAYLATLRIDRGKTEGYVLSARLTDDTEGLCEGNVDERWVVESKDFKTLIANTAEAAIIIEKWLAVLVKRLEEDMAKRKDAPHPSGTMIGWEALTDDRTNIQAFLEKKIPNFRE